ncbi:hypothetical protein THIX_60834 [Thiomonas sp. X19]|nr:hypothetical protein THIX_60834 [Thiomonas sp. X19]
MKQTVVVEVQGKRIALLEEQGVGVDCHVALQVERPNPHNGWDARRGQPGNGREGMGSPRLRAGDGRDGEDAGGDADVRNDALPDVHWPGFHLAAEGGDEPRVRRTGRPQKASDDTFQDRYLPCGANGALRFGPKVRGQAAQDWDGRNEDPGYEQRHDERGDCGIKMQNEE